MHAIYLFKALSDLTRIRIVRLLAEVGREVCVGEFVEALEVEQYNVSKQVKILEAAGLISSRKRGRFVCISLAQTGESEITQLHSLIAGLEDKNKVFTRDLKRLESIPAAAEAEKGNKVTGQSRQSVARGEPVSFTPLPSHLL